MLEFASLVVGDLLVGLRLDCQARDDIYSANQVDSDYVGYYD